MCWCATNVILAHKTLKLKSYLHKHKKHLFKKQVALHWIVTASQIMSKQKAINYLSPSFFFLLSIENISLGLCRIPSFYLCHLLLHEIDTSLLLNKKKNVLFCQTFLVECNYSHLCHKNGHTNPPERSAVSQRVTLIQLDAWTYLKSLYFKG